METFASDQNSLMWLVHLFLGATVAVQVVMALLFVASVWTWAIIVTHWLRMRRITRDSQRFERDFWKTDNIDDFYQRRGRSDLPAAKVFAAAIGEWELSIKAKVLDKDGTSNRLAVAMHSTVAAETDRLASNLNILATVGSVAPFVGLFGTVLGIMVSFSRIAQEKSTSLDVVAPGIAEALFATAIGLFAAIPAVIAYNRFSYGINRLEARLQRFADGVHGHLSRELEREA